MIHLDQLIATLMQVVIENAGAETGALVLLEENLLTVVAQCSRNRQCDLKKLTVADCATIPVVVIHSVERTQETLVLDDAVSDPSFLSDPYIQSHQTRSLLCLPILQQSQLIGILYLENNLSTGVFTRDRLQVLNLLMVQAAISLENTRLYEQLADHAETLERKVEAQTQALQQEIAERRQAEEALQRSEAKFRAIFENSQIGIFRVRTSDGLILDANQRFANLYGFDSPEEMTGLKRTTDYYVNPSERQQFLELLKRDKEVRSYEVQMRKRDGTVFWGLFSSYLNAADGCIGGVIADISEAKRIEDKHKQAEAALRQSEANYRNLLQTANSVILRYDPQGRIRYINDYGVKLLGYEEHQILGRTLFETIVPETNTHGRDLRPFIHDLLRNPQSYPQGENENLCRDGRRVWMTWSNQVIFNEQGEVVEILSVGNDITQRKQAEEALQRSEAKFRAIFENSQVGIYRTRISDGLILNANQRLANLLGFDSPQEIIGLKRTTDHYVNPSERQQFLELLKRDGEVRSYEVQVRKRDGTPFWELFSFHLNADDDYIEGVVADISDRKQAEAASILEERNRMAREIHDTLAQAFTGILAQVGAANQVLTDDVEATGAHLDLIKELARTGLTEARRSVVALRPQLLEEGSLQSALHRLVTQIRAAANDTTLYYEIKGTAYALSTEVESNLLRIGQEALTNAIKHANADEIRVELGYDRDRFCLCVKDNGQGFGVGNIPACEGFGLLGMSERAERVGAQLTIRSQPGQGTEIVVVVGV